MAWERTQVLAAFGRKLRELRTAKGLSQEELAYMADLNRNYINQVETGKRNVSVLNIVRIADALEVDPMELLRLPRA